MPAALAEPTVAPQHSPHGEQDSAVLTPEVDIQEEQAPETQISSSEQTPATPDTPVVDPVVAAPMEVAPMMAGPAAVAPMEGNFIADEEAGIATENEAPAQEFASGEGSAPPSGGDAPPSGPSDVGGSGSGDAGSSGGDEASIVEEKTASSEGEQEKEKEGKGASGEAPEGPVHTTPRTPEEDPNFQATVARKDGTVTEQQAHEEPAAAAGAAQASSTSPANERESMAEAGQVNEMDREEPGVFDAASFKAMLMEAIAAILPENNDEADKFADSGKVDRVKNQATSQVESEKESAAGDIEQKTQEEPDTSSVPERQIQPLAPQDPGPAPVDIAAGSAMPPTRGAAEVNAPLDQNVDEVEQAKADAEVTDEQLLRGNEPAFTDAVNKSDEAKQHAQEAPVQFRQQEQETLARSEAGAQAAGESQLAAMHQERTGVMGQVSADQQNTATSDTSERQKVADHINGIYEQTKTDVEDILNRLDTSVESMFDKAADKATRAFERLVDRRMSAYKSRRYSGLIGKGRWVKDLFAGLPEEANRFFTEGRNLYLEIMDGKLTLIAEHVATELTAAKTRIQKGKQEIQDYVVSLPKDLQQVGKDAADAINDKFDELKESVNAKGEELVDMIADMYKESLEAVDARIEEMKAANRGLIDMALGALIGVIETILKIKNLLFELLAAALEVIGTIISDPIGFLSNLIEGVKQGINNFFSNILNNVMTGLIEWLTGSLGDVGITMPDNLFSLSGIFDLVTQILGLTWDYFRDKAVKTLGEPMVAAMETGFELFQIIRKDGVAGLWEHIKEQFTDLKEMVMDAIRDMIVTKVIEAGIKWILGLLNPAGAFIKAAMLIIDVVKFFVERAAQIFELVQAFIEGIKAVASGNVSAVAKAIEKALVKAIPVLIGFLAALVGVTGLTSKVQKIIKKVRKRIDKAINKIIKKAKRAFGKLMGKKKPKKGDAKKIKEDNKKGKPEELTTADKKKHKNINKAIAEKLNTPPKDDESFADFYKRKQKEAEKLEDKYQPQLKRGINLDITFKSLKKDEGDGDLDIKSIIAPNNDELPIRVDYTLKRGGVDDPAKRNELARALKAKVAGDGLKLFSLNQAITYINQILGKSLGKSSIQKIMKQLRLPETSPQLFLIGQSNSFIENHDASLIREIENDLGSSGIFESANVRKIIADYFGVEEKNDRGLIDRHLKKLVVGGMLFHNGGKSYKSFYAFTQEDLDTIGEGKKPTDYLKLSIDYDNLVALLGLGLTPPWPANPKNRKGKNKVDAAQTKNFRHALIKHIVETPQFSQDIGTLNTKVLQKPGIPTKLNALRGKIFEQWLNTRGTTIGAYTRSPSFFKEDYGALKKKVRFADGYTGRTLLEVKVTAEPRDPSRDELEQMTDYKYLLDEDATWKPGKDDAPIVFNSIRYSFNDQGTASRWFEEGDPPIAQQKLENYYQAPAIGQ